MPVLTIEFNTPMNDILQEMADKKGCTKVDILRRAVAVYKYITNELHCRRAGDPVKKLVIRKRRCNIERDCSTMKLKEYLIVALPFAQSDATAEFTEFGVSEEDALKQFRAKNPMFRVKEITER